MNNKQDHRKCKIREEKYKTKNNNHNKDKEKNKKLILRNLFKKKHHKNLHY